MFYGWFVRNFVHSRSCKTVINLNRIGRWFGRVVGHILIGKGAVRSERVSFHTFTPSKVLAMVGY